MTTPTREPLSKTDIARICRDCYGRPRFGESEYLFAKSVERKVSAELEATIEQLRTELDGEKAAAMNYRADAIKAEKQRDDLLKEFEHHKEQTRSIQKFIDAIASAKVGRVIQVGETISAPKLPTEEMIFAGMEASVAGRPSVDDESYVLSIYGAMLEAAPSAASAKGGAA